MARITVMGTGAVGGYFGACLARAGHHVAFVARGTNLRALRSQGLRITGAMGEFAINQANVDEQPPEADLVLLCVKNYDLHAACDAVKHQTGTALTLQNGVDAPSVASEILPGRVLAGSTGIVADLAEPGHVHVVSSYAWIRFGEPDGSALSDRVEQVRGWLDVDGIEAIPAPDARVALWEKMALMCGMAGLTTLYQIPIGEVLRGELRTTFEAIVHECGSVARASGVALPDDFVEKRMGYADRIDPSAMSSMSRDFARGRPIELDTFNGAVVRMGRELGIEAPANRAVYAAIAAKR